MISKYASSISLYSILILAGCSGTTNSPSGGVLVSSVSCAGFTTPSSCPSGACRWDNTVNECFPNEAPICTTATYSCGANTLDTSPLSGYQLNLVNALGYQCGPTAISDLCFGQSQVISTGTGMSVVNPIQSANQADICSAVEFINAAYFCQNVFSQYQSNSSLLKGKTVVTDFNDNTLAIDWSGTKQCSEVGVCNVPLDIQYFTVDDAQNNTFWISIRGTVFPAGTTPNYSGSVQDIYTALTSTTIGLINSQTNATLQASGGALFSGQATTLNGVNFHSGFLSLAQGILLKLNSTIPAGRQIKVTGHSLGAGAAVILGLMLMDQGKNVTEIYNFGQPMLTDVAGAQMISTFLLGKAVDYIRFIQGFDPVPFLPLTVVNETTGVSAYAHFGDEFRIGLGSSFCTSGMGQPGCYTIKQLAGQTSFAYMNNGTLGYPLDSGLNAVTEHSTALYLHRLEQLGCPISQALHEVLQESCSALVTDNNDSPGNQAECTPTLTCGQ